MWMFYLEILFNSVDFMRDFGVGKMGEIIHTLTVHRLISLHPIPDCRILKIGVAMDQIGTAVLFVELPGSSR